MRFLAFGQPCENYLARLLKQVKKVINNKTEQFKLIGVLNS
jgi:hypothetical protein